MLDVPHLLGLLQEDPDDADAIRELRAAVESRDPARLGPDPLRLLAAARRSHQDRGETWTAAQLLELEAALASADPDAEAALQKELGRLWREELLDDDLARLAFERARQLRPGDVEVQEALEGIAQAEANWKEIARRYLDEAEGSSDATLKTSLLASAASLVWKYKKRGRDKDVDRIFGEALASDPGDPRATKLYEQILRKREKWDVLANVLLEAAEKTKSRDDRVAFYLRAARVLARKLQSPERAAACYERVLDYSPAHPEGMRFLVEYFTAREQWDHLVALYDDALRGRQKLESEQGILLQIGMVHWRLRHAPAEAEPYFARLRKVDPAHPGMLAFYREYLPQIGDHARLLTVLSDAQRASTDPNVKAELAVELARAAQASGALDRAIDAWKAVQRHDPKNREALAALRALYRQTEKWNALVEVLRSEVDALPREAVAERLELLREMLAVYRDHLHLEAMAINVWNAILQIQPDDAEALTALASSYEQMGRWNDLIQVLMRQAESCGDVRQQVAIYMRVARLWIERFANYNQATRPLELVIERDPHNREALALLKEIYTKKRAWKQLFDVQRLEAELASDPDARHAMRIDLARVAGERLHRHADAIALWKQVLAHEPGHAEALDALEKLAEREKDWATLAEVLERRIEAQHDDKEKVKLLTRLAVVHGEHEKDPARAVDAWMRVLALEPKNGRALRTLRETFVAARDWDRLSELYARQGDWEGLAEVLGNAADREPDPAQKIALSFRAADVYESRIGEPERAFRNYERVLAVDPGNAQAARKLIAIYEKDEKWARLPALYEIVIDALPPDATAQRVALLARLRSIAADHLHDHESAFRHALEAWRLDPSSETTRAALFAAAETIDAWDRVANALAVRSAAAHGEEGVWLRRAIARLAAERLGDVERAVASLREILADDPRDAEAHAALERIFRENARWQDLRDLLLRRIEATGDEAERWRLLREVARLEESELGDSESAATHWRAALAIDGTDRDALLALQRLAEKAGRWSEVVQITERLRDLADRDEERTELTLRIGEILVDRAPDGARALLELGRVLEHRSGDRRAIAALEIVVAKGGETGEAASRLLEGAYEAAGEWGKLRAAIERRLAASRDREERRALRLRLAELSATRADDPASAYRVLESAFLDDPADDSLWGPLFAAADRAGKHAELASALATAIEAGGLDEASSVQLADKVAALYDDVLARPADAEPFHRRVLAADPLHDRAFVALKDLYTKAERWDDLQVLYRNRIAQTLDAGAKLELLLQVCFLFEELIDDPTLAIHAYREVLDLDPTHAASRRALDRLYTRTARWRDLAALIEQELANASGEAAVALLQRLGELHETKLDEPALAVDRYESVLRADPDHDGARAALERLLESESQRHRVATILEPVYEHRRAWSDLARVLEVQLERVHEPSSRVGLLSRLADIYENRLADNENAFEAWARAVACDPSDPTARRELGRVAVMLGREQTRAEVLERAVAASEASPGLQAELLLELATLWDDRLEDPARAEAAYERLVDVASDDPEMVIRACRALERIHSGRGEHAKLAQDLRRQAKLEPDPAVRKALLVRLAELLEGPLQDAEGAIAVHNERLELDPNDVDALGALERLYERLGRWQPLIGVLSNREAFAGTDEERRAIARRIAAIYDEKLNDLENAIIAYNDVVARFGSDEASLVALTRLYEKAERWSDLLDVLQMVHDLVPSATDKAQIRFHAAELMRRRTQETDRAIETYAEVLEVLPSHEGAIAALREVMAEGSGEARLAAARVLRPRLEASAEPAALLACLDVLASSDDPVEQLGALRRAADVADVGLGDPARAFDLAARALRAGLHEPDVGHLIADLERFAAASERWPDLVALLGEVAPDLSDADLQVATWQKIADIARRRLGDAEFARRQYQRILEQRPDHAGALDALEEMTTEAGDAPALLEVLRRKADLASGRERIALLMRQAEVCETKLSDITGAIDAYETVLAEDPAHLAAYQALERSYSAQARFSDLASLYERMLERRVGVAVEIRYRLGRLQREQLRDEAAAVEQFREALALGAPHEPTLEQLEQIMRSDSEQRSAAAAILEPIYLSRLQWPRVVEALEARIADESDVEARKILLARLGRVYEEYLEDLDGAMGVYARLFREDPSDEGTWETLGRLARVLERWDRLAGIYAKVIEDRGVEDDVTLALATMAARTYDQQTDTPEKAVDLYRKALRFAPEDRAVFDALEALLRRLQRWDALLELYEEQVQIAPREEDRVALWLQIARLRRDRKGDADGAVAAFQEVLAVDGAHPEATAALDVLLTERERWSDLAELLRRRIDFEGDARQRLDLKHRLGTLLAQKLDDEVGAIDLFEEITRDDPRHAPTVAALERLVTKPDHQARIIEILEPIYQATDQWKKRIAIYEALVARSDDPSEKVRLLQEIARLHEERGRDPHLALHACARALAIEPSREDVRADVDRLAAALGAWDALVEAYEQAVAASTDPAVTSALLGTIARVHDEKRGDPRSAIETYERLAQHDTQDTSALDALEALHTLVGDWRGLVDVLRRKVERSYDPVERGELLRRAGSVLEDLLGDRGAAIGMYERALAEDPDDAVALESLDRLHEEANDHQALGRVLQRRIELEQDPALRADIALRLGAIAEEHLRDLDVAVAAFARALEDRPGEPTALTALSRLYERQRMWPELLDNLRLQESLSKDPAERVAYLHRAAEILERELDDVPEALSLLGRVLAIDPRHEPTIQALIRIARLEEHRAAACGIVLPLLRERQRWDEVATLLELTAEAATDPTEKREILRELAGVHERGRNDRYAAFEAFRRALVEDPTDLRSADDLERIAGAVGIWEKVADVLAARASSVLDPEIARNLYGRLARIAENNLGDDARAVEAHRRVIEQVGDDEQTLLALDRLHQKAQAWQELADVLERRARVTSEPSTRIDLLVRLGTLRWERFDDRRGALAAFTEVLENQPDEPRAIGAVEGLLADEELAAQAVDVLDAAYRRTGASAKIAALYEVRITLAAEGERVALLGELAQLHEHDLQDPGSALSCMIRAFEIDGRDESLLAEIERLAAIVGGWDQLRGFVERVAERHALEPASRRDLELRAAGWYRDRLGDEAAAEAALRRAIACDRESSDAHARLVELLRAPGRERDLVDALTAWSEVEYDESARRERLREAARLAESALGDVARAADLYQRVLAVDGGDVDALDRLIRLRTATGDWASVASLLERRIDVETDPERRVALRRRLAETFAGPLGDGPRAIEAWRNVLDEVPTDLDAIGRLEQLYEAAERWHDVEELVQRRLDLAQTPDERIAARVRLARLQETRFGRRAEAIEQLQEILGEDPSNEEALDELDRLYAADGRHAERVALLERRAADAARRGEGAVEIAVLGRLAAAHESHGDVEAAIAAHERVLARDPMRREAIRGIARLQAARGRHAEAADALERLLPMLDDLAELQREAFAVADLAEGPLGDPARAERVLRTAHEADPRHVGVRRRLQALYEKLGRDADLARMLALDAEDLPDGKEKSTLYRRIADVYASRLSDPASAAQFLERAARLEPDNREVLLPLCDLYIAAGRQADAIPVLEKIIASYGTRRSKELAVFHHRLGQAFERMGDTLRALAAYDAAFKIDLTSVPILRDLGRLCYASGDFDRAQKTFRALLLQKLDGNSGITKGDIYFYLGDIAAKQGDPKKAISMLERALAEDAGHARARELLGTLKG